MSDAQDTQSPDPDLPNIEDSSVEAPAADTSDHADNNETDVKAQDKNKIKAPPAGKDSVILNDIYHINPKKRLAHLDNGPVKAYEASSQANKTLFAMICEAHLPPRFRDTEVYQKNTETSLLKYVSSGTVYWPPEGMYKHAIIYEGNPGKPILENPANAALGMKPEYVMKTFLKPVISGLRGLRDLDLYHGHIRLDNIFGAAEDGAIDNVVLGDCLCLPSGYTDMTTYLPVHKALAQPSGRGLGNISDDLYSIGVCAAIMLRSADPMEGMSEKEILGMKLAQGSYMTLTNKDRFSGGILELLRGLLQDDPAQRWTMDEILSWMEGQRLVPKQGVKRIKAGRPMVIGNQKFYHAETLAMEMPEHLNEAAQQIENDQMEQWIARSLEDNKKVEKLEVAIRTAREYGRTSYYYERLICRTSIVLDPKQPIRYRDYSLFPDGFGVAMAEAFKARKDMNAFRHMINQQIVPFWLDQQSDTFVDIGQIAVNFEACRNALKQKQQGYGLENCLYVLAPECPCLSEQYEKYLIRDSKDLLDALEEMAGKGKMPRDIFDPHLTAFLLVRENRVIDSHMPELSSSEGYRRILGTIKVLAAIQKASDVKQVKNLTKWAAKYVQPFFKRYHDKKIRDEKKEEIESVKGKGDLKEFVKIMDDPEALQKDSLEFKRAIRDYYKLKVENFKYEKALREREDYGVSSGREVAAIASGFVASIIILVVTFIFFSGGDVMP